jgi:hypothetical protein
MHVFIILHRRVLKGWYRVSQLSKHLESYMMRWDQHDKRKCMLAWVEVIQANHDVVMHRTEEAAYRSLLTCMQVNTALIVFFCPCCDCMCKWLNTVCVQAWSAEVKARQILSSRFRIIRLHQR